MRRGKVHFRIPQTGKQDKIGDTTVNRKGTIVVVSAIALVALMLTTGRGMLNGDAWPPAPMPTDSLAGTWIQTVAEDPPDAIDIATISPEDPRSAKGFCVATDINPDPTLDGLWPEAESWTPWFGTYVRTGCDTWQMKCIGYARKDTKPKPTVLYIMILEGTYTMTAADVVEHVGTLSFYRVGQDSDGDGLPDEGQQAEMSIPVSAELRPL